MNVTSPLLPLGATVSDDKILGCYHCGKRAYQVRYTMPDGQRHLSGMCSNCFTNWARLLSDWLTRTGGFEYNKHATW